ncbi:unnamed protein product [Clonostachys rosea]|uniref:Uncharacterized protein n=1 Tax=Bionectria ochroleuca TaxID=29856 RepID=A0ABY6TXD5_BIOOC|nr:unnamed protein product [Clonostachys rosea]
MGEVQVVGPPLDDYQTAGPSSPESGHGREESAKLQVGQPRSINEISAIGYAALGGRASPIAAGQSVAAERAKTLRPMAVPRYRYAPRLIVV